MKVCIPITKREYDIQKALGSLPVWLQILAGDVERETFTPQRFDEFRRWLLSLPRGEAREKVQSIFDLGGRNEIIQEWVKAILNARTLVNHLVTQAEMEEIQKKKSHSISTDTLFGVVSALGALILSLIYILV